MPLGSPLLGNPMVNCAIDKKDTVKRGKIKVYMLAPPLHPPAFLSTPRTLPQLQLRVAVALVVRAIYSYLYLEHLRFFSRLFPPLFGSTQANIAYKHELMLQPPLHQIRTCLQENTVVSFDRAPLNCLSISFFVYFLFPVFCNPLHNTFFPVSQCQKNIFLPPLQMKSFIPWSPQQQQGHHHHHSPLPPPSSWPHGPRTTAVTRAAALVAVESEWAAAASLQFPSATVF